MVDRLPYREGKRPFNIGDAKLQVSALADLVGHPIRDYLRVLRAIQQVYLYRLLSYPDHIASLQARESY